MRISAPRRWRGGCGERHGANQKTQVIPQFGQSSHVVKGARRLRADRYLRAWHRHEASGVAARDLEQAIADLVEFATELVKIARPECAS